MKKSNKKEIPNVKEIMEDANRALEVIDEIDGLDLETGDIKKFEKKLQNIEKELTTKYKKYKHNFNLSKDIQDIEKQIREEMKDNLDVEE